MKNAITKCARNPNELFARRGYALAQLESTSSHLTPQRARRIGRVPGNSPAAKINFPLIFIIKIARQYSGGLFVTDLSKGMPIAGPISPTPGLIARKRCAEMSFREWEEGIPERNKKIYERVLKSQNSELTGICWEKTHAEVKERWITTPTEVAETMPRATPLTPRYAISGQHDTNGFQ